MFRSLVTSVLFVAFLMSGQVPYAQADIATMVGQPAPEFSAQDTTGVTRKLSEFQGKYVVLEWFNFECPFVKKHYDTENMQKLQSRFTGEGVIWLSINSSAPGKQGHLDPVQANKLRAEKSVASTATILDPSGQIGRLYGAKTTPHMYVINPQGMLIYAGAIDDDDSTRIDSVAGAKNYVVAALEEAKAGKTIAKASTRPYGCSVKYDI